MKKTESAPIKFNNHEKMLIRRIVRFYREIDRKARIKKEDAEDEKYRRKIVK